MKRSLRARIRRAAPDIRPEEGEPAIRPWPGRGRQPHRPVIGLVLGSGVARGWAHIGVLEGLAEIGVEPDIVSGCSSGALVGASFAAGRLETLTRLARSMTRTRTFGFLDVGFARGGIIEGRWIVDFFREHIGDIAIKTPSAYSAPWRPN